MRSSLRGRSDSLRKSPRVGAETFCHVLAFTSQGRIPTTNIEQHVAELENDPGFGPAFFELGHLTSVTRD